ncbi:MAG: ABC transporter [Candidatus Parabeggiatoa sp. nov. 3]|nr:MAG: ABC transporter [Gammaproteobacteria bacterium]RKZ57728.1 MAG: ABC transporter [Gammaproteobacteria bacterium]RKZ79060.1 MAG: ABC transporter [Gammaproteobacteria bacterium]
MVGNSPPTINNQTMQVTKRTHLQNSLQSTTFMVLITIAIALIAWLSTRYEIKADWTINNRHTLSEASQKLLAELKGPVTITAYASDEQNLRGPIKDLVERYQREKPDLTLRFIDPLTTPGESRERGIQFNGELIIDYQNSTEHVRQIPPSLSEQILTSALQRLIRTDNRFIAFLEGHGERSATAFESHDLSQWVQALRNSGFNMQTLNLAQIAQVPDNIKALVIASPRNKLLPTEINLITNYIDKGGNLLWLTDPSVPLQGLEALAQKIGLTVHPGIIIDLRSQYVGFVPITTTEYGRHPITSGVSQYLTLFPQTQGITVEPAEEENWLETALLTSHEQSWSETGEIDENLEYNEETDIEGPLDIAVALVRDKPETAETTHVPEKDIEDDSNEEPQADLEGDETEENDLETDIQEEPVIQEQRVIIVGDGDFLSNAYVGYGGNLDLGVKMMNWLAEDDNMVQIPTKTSVDLNLTLSWNAVILLGGFFLFLLPIGLIATGISVWLHRRKG